MELAERFWSKVDRRGPDECWPWIAGRSSRGYGYVKVDGRQVGAHRVALELTTGRQLAPGVYACHTCDNPPCCNPAHLYAGNVTTNNRDTLARGRVVFTAERRARVGAGVKAAWADGRHAPAKARTHCYKGHPLVAGNIYYIRSRKHPEAAPARRCRACTLDGIHARRG